MLISIRVQNGGSIQVNVDRSPDRCPVCHSSIVAADMNVSFLFRTRVERVFQCPNTDCQILFIAKYDQIPQQGHNYNWKSSVPFEFLTTSDTETIESISADFCEIYAQSEKAEQQGLNLVAGPGYRKALEFLMKDYACMLEPDKKDTIDKDASWALYCHVHQKRPDKSDREKGSVAWQRRNALRTQVGR
jgi:hypothetical protein